MSGRRGALVAVGAVAVVAATAIGATAATRDGDASTSTTQAAATVAVLRQDLEVNDTTTATLTFVASDTIVAPTDGTVTALVADGESVTAGTVVASIDSEPVVALHGDVPSWRDLDSSSSDGVDIYQLETNLVALGHDLDGAITIDGEFDDATVAAVEAWNESLGIDDDATVPASRIAWIPGELLIDTTSVDLGATVTEGDDLLSGRLVDRVFTTPATVEGDGDGSGTVAVAAEGTEVVSGTVLFTDGGVPVVAAVGDVATLARLERELSSGSDAGSDIALVEAMLAATGFDAGGALVVDETFDDATATALADWYTSLGIATDAASVTVPAGGVVVVPAGLTVGAPLATADGSTIPRLTAPARVVTTSAPLDDPGFALGAGVTVEYPDGTTTTGAVSEVGTTATNSTGEPGGQATVEITIQVDEVPDSVAGYVEIPVTLSVLTERIESAFLVPTSALVALAEGGYALEVADGADSRLIAVEPGIYQDGFVQVTGDEVVEGLEVVVPS